MCVNIFTYLGSTLPIILCGFTDVTEGGSRQKEKKDGGTAIQLTFTLV